MCVSFPLALFFSRDLNLCFVCYDVFSCFRRVSSCVLGRYTAFCAPLSLPKGSAWQYFDTEIGSEVGGKRQHKREVVFRVRVRVVRAKLCAGQLPSVRGYVQIPCLATAPFAAVAAAPLVFRGRHVQQTPETYKHSFKYNHAKNIVKQ